MDALPSHLYPTNLRARAARCRAVAETFRDECVRMKMLKVADGYELMAVAAERCEKQTSL